MLRHRWLVFLGIALALAGAALLPQPSSTGTAGPAPKVAILGDSLSTGCCAPTQSTWNAIFAGRLGAGQLNVAVGGATAGMLVHQNKTWPSGRTQPQLAEAVALIQGSPTTIATTLAIGTNDFFENAFMRDPNTNEICAYNITFACESQWALSKGNFRNNIEIILSTLADALPPDTPIIVMTVYLGGPDHWMNTYLKEEAAEHGAYVADVSLYFSQLQQTNLLAGDNTHKVAAGHRVIADVFTNAMPPDSEGDGLSDLMESVYWSDPHNPDSDGDGCTDGREFGPNAAMGGQRSPSSFWDFYDVWTHPLGQPLAWERDGVITISDVLAVAKRFGVGQVPGQNYLAVAAALTPPTSDLGYHPAFDRGITLGSRDWQRAKADGAITTADDILAVAKQFGHSCA